MLRLAAFRPLLIFGARRFVATEAAESGAAVREVSRDQIWSLWNEGNLFSLAAGELVLFLSKNGIDVDPASKKAALVRKVEELLQQQDASQRGKSTQQGSQYGNNWDKTAPASETLLDLAQAGFYDGANQILPRAFQILNEQCSPDVVVSRVNTTSFPGFPANSECYTLTAAEAEQSVRARYSKALQWCVMNMKNMNLDGEVCVDFGKLIVNADVLRKNRKVVSSWTLQQRLQTNNPYHWVTAMSHNSIKDITSALSTAGFTVKQQNAVRYHAVVRRATDSLEITLDSAGKPMQVNKPWDFLQTSFLVRADGADTRFMLRSRQPAKKIDVDKYVQSPLLVLGEQVTSALKPELGLVVYTSKDEMRRWEKQLSIGVALTVTETKRTPLIVTKDEEENRRLEYMITCGIAPKKSDLPTLANEVFGLAKALVATTAEEFVKQFDTVPEAPDVSSE